MDFQVSGLKVSHPLQLPNLLAECLTAKPPLLRSPDHQSQRFGIEALGRARRTRVESVACFPEETPSCCSVAGAHTPVCAEEECSRTAGARPARPDILAEATALPARARRSAPSTPTRIRSARSKSATASHVWSLTVFPSWTCTSASSDSTPATGSESPPWQRCTVGSAFQSSSSTSGSASMRKYSSAMATKACCTPAWSGPHTAVRVCSTSR
eukprot:3653698-Rhodomonas_salina.2